MTMKEWFSQI